MLHWGRFGWGRFPPFKMTTVSRAFRCRKWTCITILVAACPGHPSTGKLCRPPLDGNAMRYVRVSSPVAEVSSSVSPLPIAHTVSSCAPPNIPLPSPPCTPCTIPVPSVAPGRRAPLPSSFTHTPPPTGSPPPGMGGRPFQLSSQNNSACSSYRTGRPGYQMNPRAIVGLTMQP